MYTISIDPVCNFYQFLLFLSNKHPSGPEKLFCNICILMNFSLSFRTNFFSMKVTFQTIRRCKQEKKVYSRVSTESPFFIRQYPKMIVTFSTLGWRYSEHTIFSRGESKRQSRSQLKAERTLSVRPCQ